MDTRRLGQLNITGFGSGVDPSVAVPDPSINQNPGNNGGGGNTGGTVYDPNTGRQAGTNFQVLNPANLAPAGSAFNPYISEAGGTMNFNPIPNNTPVNPNDAVGFVSGFTFGQQDFTGNPEADMAMDTFNKIKAQFGHNAAWTWMMKSAWNPLGQIVQSKINNAGITGTDRGRIINTYSTNANYFPGLKSESVGNPFNPTDPFTKLTSPYRDFTNAYNTAVQKGTTPPSLPTGYQMGTYGATTGYKSTGTNVDPTIPQGYATPDGRLAINPQTGKEYTLADAGGGQYAPPAPAGAAPASTSILQGPTGAQGPTRTQAGTAPAVAVPDPGWANISANQQRPTQAPTTVNPFGDLSGYRYLS